MKVAAVYLMLNLTSVACIGGATTLAVYGIGGWGWFLLVGFLLHCHPKRVES